MSFPNQLTLNPAKRKTKRCRIPLFNAMHLRQDIGRGDGQKSPGRNADGEGDIFRRKASEKIKRRARRL